MKYLVSDIIEEIETIINEQINYLEKNIAGLSEEDLNWRPGKNRWTIYEVIEHLNRFGVFYIPKIRNVIEYPKTVKASDFYKSGIIAEYAFRSIRPKNGVIHNKARARNGYNPFLRKLDRSVIDEHKEQQLKIIKLAHESQMINLSKNGVPTMLSRWIKLNLGDSMRVVVYHSERHYVQLDNLVNKRVDA